ncbi:hypothetical protein LIT25_08255 [Bacillus sp. F19]|nr:hypothetical protein LIT25_08255 [Bacillus sp. F19]
MKQQTLIQLLKGEKQQTNGFTERAERLNLNLFVERQAVLFHLPEQIPLKQRQLFMRKLEQKSGTNDLVVSI